MKLQKGKKTMDNITGFFAKKKQKDTPVGAEDPIQMIQKLSELKNTGILSEEEFEEKKKELLSRI